MNIGEMRFTKTTPAEGLSDGVYPYAKGVEVMTEKGPFRHAVMFHECEEEGATRQLTQWAENKLHETTHIEVTTDPEQYVY